MRLKDVTSFVGLPIIIKIGGVEAVTDIYEALSLGVGGIIAPMSETAFSTSKFLDAIDTFDIICVNCNSSEEYKTKFEEALQYFIKEEVHFISDGISGLFYIGEKIEERFITRNNFSEMKAIISKMCCLEKTEEEDIMADLNIEDPIEYERIKQIRLRLKKAKARQSAE